MYKLNPFPEVNLVEVSNEYITEWLGEGKYVPWEYVLTAINCNRCKKTRDCETCQQPVLLVTTSNSSLHRSPNDHDVEVSVCVNCKVQFGSWILL